MLKKNTLIFTQLEQATPASTEYLKGHNYPRKKLLFFNI